MILPNSPFFVSSLVIEQNAVKNIIFRAATLVLNFAVLRFFAYLAFQRQDYTTFLMFAEDIVQKTMFAFSRKLSRQSLLVAVFSLFTTAVGFYDTLLWALDSPGYVLQQKSLSANLLSSQMVESPAYISFISGNPLNPNINNLNVTFGANLYAPGPNFTLPGIIAPGIAEVAAAVRPLDPEYPARIWLDSDGFAVGLDELFMTTVNMVENFCYPSNPIGEKTTQTWHCNIRPIDGLDMFTNHIGRPQIYWDIDHSEYLTPEHSDNPWKSLGTGGQTALMKQVFTVTKGLRKHTFLSTVFKATMISSPPNVFADAEITDFMRRTWSPNATLTPGIQKLTNYVLAAKYNQTGISFGVFIQGNDSVVSISTDYLNVAGTPNAIGNASNIGYNAIRFSSINITLLRSETMVKEPTPLAPCPGAVYRNLATGGVVRSTNCNVLVAENQTSTSPSGRFLGQIDTSAVLIISDLLGDGTSNITSVALSNSGITWYNENADRIDQLLISRALILGGTRADVQVLVQYTKAAISQLQLVLCILPFILAIIVWAVTLRKGMSYFKNSFLAAVLASTHVSTSPCEDIGYIHSPPEISLTRKGTHINLGTPHGRTIANIASDPVDEHGLIYEPLILEKDQEVEARTDYSP